jgi:hypothetical protein
MNTKKPAKIAETVTKKTPVAAKPLGKSQPAPKLVKTSPAAAPKPVVKKISPAPAVKKIITAPAVAVKAAAEAAKAEKVVKVKVAKKPKVVRDSFTMPQSEYLKIAEIKELCLKAGLQVKKSEVLRAGVIALCAMSEAQLNRTMSALDKIKTGRPNKH